jgi:hypothetical protein
MARLLFPGSESFLAKGFPAIVIEAFKAALLESFSAGLEEAEKEAEAPLTKEEITIAKEGLSPKEPGAVEGALTSLRWEHKGALYERDLLARLAEGAKVQEELRRPPKLKGIAYDCLEALLAAIADVDGGATIPEEFQVKAERKGKARLLPLKIEDLRSSLEDFRGEITPGYLVCVEEGELLEREEGAELPKLKREIEAAYTSALGAVIKRKNKLENAIGVKRKQEGAPEEKKEEEGAPDIGKEIDASRLEEQRSALERLRGWVSMGRRLGGLRRFINALIEYIRDSKYCPDNELLPPAPTFHELKSVQEFKELIKGRSVLSPGAFAVSGKEAPQYYEEGCRELPPGALFPIYVVAHEDSRGGGKKAREANAEAVAAAKEALDGAKGEVAAIKAEVPHFMYLSERILEAAPPSTAAFERSLGEGEGEAEDSDEDEVDEYASMLDDYEKHWHLIEGGLRKALEDGHLERVMSAEEVEALNEHMRKMEARRAQRGSIESYLKSMFKIVGERIARRNAAKGEALAKRIKVILRTAADKKNSSIRNRAKATELYSGLEEEAAQALSQLKAAEKALREEIAREGLEGAGAPPSFLLIEGEVYRPLEGVAREELVRVIAAKRAVVVYRARPAPTEGEGSSLEEVLQNCLRALSFYVDLDQLFLEGGGEKQKDLAKYLVKKGVSLKRVLRWVLRLQQEQQAPQRQAEAREARKAKKAARREAAREAALERENAKARENRFEILGDCCDSDSDSASAYGSEAESEALPSRFGRAWPRGFGLPHPVYRVHLRAKGGPAAREGGAGSGSNPDSASDSDSDSDSDSGSDLDAEEYADDYCWEFQYSGSGAASGSSDEAGSPEGAGEEAFGVAVKIDPKRFYTALKGCVEKGDAARKPKAESLRAKAWAYMEATRKAVGERLQANLESESELKRLEGWKQPAPDRSEAIAFGKKALEQLGRSDKLRSFLVNSTLTRFCTTLEGILSLIQAELVDNPIHTLFEKLMEAVDDIQYRNGLKRQELLDALRASTGNREREREARRALDADRVKNAHCTKYLTDPIVTNIRKTVASRAAPGGMRYGDPVFNRKAARWVELRAKREKCESDLAKARKELGELTREAEGGGAEERKGPEISEERRKTLLEIIRQQEGGLAEALKELGPLDEELWPWIREKVPYPEDKVAELMEEAERMKEKAMRLSNLYAEGRVILDELKAQRRSTRTVLPDGSLVSFEGIVIRKGSAAFVAREGYKAEVGKLRGLLKTAGARLAQDIQLFQDHVLTSSKAIRPNVLAFHKELDALTQSVRIRRGAYLKLWSTAMLPRGSPAMLPSGRRKPSLHAPDSYKKELKIRGLEFFQGYLKRILEEEREVRESFKENLARGVSPAEIEEYLGKQAERLVAFNAMRMPQAKKAEALALAAKQAQELYEAASTPETKERLLQGIQMLRLGVRNEWEVEGLRVLEEELRAKGVEAPRELEEARLRIRFSVASRVHTVVQQKVERYKRKDFKAKKYWAEAIRLELEAQLKEEKRISFERGEEPKEDTRGNSKSFRRKAPGKSQAQKVRLEKVKERVVEASREARAGGVALRSRGFKSRRQRKKGGLSDIQSKLKKEEKELAEKEAKRRKHEAQQLFHTVWGDFTRFYEGKAKEELERRKKRKARRAGKPEQEAEEAEEEEEESYHVRLSTGIRTGLEVVGRGRVQEVVKQMQADGELELGASGAPIDQKAYEEAFNKLAGRLQELARFEGLKQDLDRAFDRRHQYQGASKEAERLLERQVDKAAARIKESEIEIRTLRGLIDAMRSGRARVAEKAKERKEGAREKRNGGAKKEKKACSKAAKE